MKKIAINLLAGFLAMTGYAQEKNAFTLSGTIKEATYPYVYLQYTGTDGPVKDSCRIEDGRFIFKGNLAEPTMAFIRGKMESRRMDDPNFAQLFLEPAPMTIHLTAGDFKNFEMTGSKTQGEMTALTKQKASIRKELQPFLDEYNRANEAYRAAKKAKKPEAELEALKEKAAGVREKFQPYNAQMNKIDDTFIRTHPNSYLSAYLLRFKMSSLTLDEALKAYDKLSPQVQQSSWGKVIQKEMASLKSGSPGSKATVFTTTDINGQPLSLNDFKGQYVLLDFWASWCVPCRKGNPHLLSLYAKYKDQGFEIIGISDDDSNPEAWKKAVEKDQIGVWKHVLRGLKRTETGYDKSKDISEPYGIHTLPTKILIDPNGMIIGRYGGGGGNDEAMDKKLAEIFD